MATFHILDGKRVAEAIRRDVGLGVTQLTAGGARPPGLTVLLVGEDPASAVYVGSKARSCEEVGMVSQVRRLPATTTEAELTQQLDELNADPTVDGILVQLPLPRHLPTRALLDRVDPSKDVDGFHPINVGRLWQGLPSFVPCTPAGVIEMLDREGIAVAGKHAVVVGRSDIVGKPMAALLLQRDCTVTVCHSRTPDLAATCRGAEILVAAVGRPFLIGPDHVAPGAVVIDVGMNRVSDPTLVERHIQDPKRRASFAANGSLLVGDVDFEAVASRTTAITPVPGGVGPLTVAMLLVNTLRARTERGS